MPLGGLEENSGYKGMGLAMLVEVLGGVLGGSNFGTRIRRWQGPLSDAAAKEKEQRRGGTAAAAGANLGQAFIALDPSFFCGGFAERMAEFIHQMHGLQPGEGQPDVVVPGELEHNACLEQTANGIKLHASLVDGLDQLGEAFGIAKVKIEREED